MIIQGKRKTESSTLKTETKKKKRPHQKRSLTSSSLEGGKSTKIIKRPGYVKTSVIQSTHPQHCHDYSQRASLVKSVNTTLEEMYQDYVGEQAPGSNEVSVIVLDRSSTVEQKSLKQSFTPDDVHQVPRIQNQVLTEANNLLDTCSFNKIFDNIYNFNHQVSFINKMVSMTPLLTISLHCHTIILNLFFFIQIYHGNIYSFSFIKSFIKCCGW